MYLYKECVVTVPHDAAIELGFIQRVNRTEAVVNSPHLMLMNDIRLRAQCHPCCGFAFRLIITASITTCR